MQSTPNAQQGTARSGIDGSVEWWTLKELAIRWRTSVATLRRDAARADDDPRKLRHILVGGSSIRVATAEVLRHENPGRPTERARHEPIAKPVVPDPRIRSLLTARRAAIRKTKVQHAAGRLAS